MTNARPKALIGLGSNKSWCGFDSPSIIWRAARALETLGTEVHLSPLYKSPAWPDPSAPAYTNAVAVLATSLQPEALLMALLSIEAGFGRLRSDDPAERYAPRTLDLDLLALGCATRETPELRLPHPAIAERDFVLLPLQDVAPAWTHPVTGASVAEMIDALPVITAERL
ncbi:MAG: 2-amino-4-hydroxy-6-hydroxymethyldihydropteridine diphosphokinase [Pseudomonadota bacterium]